MSTLAIKVWNIAYLLYLSLLVLTYLLILVGYLPVILIHAIVLLAAVPIVMQGLIKLKKRYLGSEFFLTIATIVSLMAHQEQAIVIVLLIMLIADYIEDIVTQRAHREIKTLLTLIPQKALVLSNGQEHEVDLDAIKPGMLIVVKTGGYIPVDGIIARGAATINQASLTGESIAQEKMVGQRVFAGTFIEAGSIVVTTHTVGTQTFFGKISLLIQEAERKKAPIAVTTDVIARYLVPLLLAFITITWLVTHNVKLVTTLLIFGSPLELTLITPLSILCGIIAAFRQGVLVKGGLVLEKFRKADTIIFDKTGTLTMGQPIIEKIQPLTPDIDAQELLRIAAIAEKRSDHVVAKAILAEAQRQGITIPDPEDYVSVPGHGVIITYKNTRCFIGNKHFLQAPEHGNIKDLPPPDYDEQYSSFYVGCAGKLYGKIYITDALRHDAQQTINDLRHYGLHNMILLSGDKQAIARSIASTLTIPLAYGEVFPDQKYAIIEHLQQQHHIVAMVGDGINDAPALKQADIGIAMGAMGMEPAIQAADIVLISNDLYKVTFMYALSKKIFQVIQQNLIIGFIVIHGLGIVLTVAGIIDPLKAALLHALSDIAILLNATRLLNFTIT